MNNYRSTIILTPGEFILTTIVKPDNYFHRPGWTRREKVKMEVERIVETPTRYSFRGHADIFSEKDEFYRKELILDLRKLKPFELPEWILEKLEDNKECIK